MHLPPWQVDSIALPIMGDALPECFMHGMLIACDANGFKVPEALDFIQSASSGSLHVAGIGAEATERNSDFLVLALQGAA